MPSCQLEPRNRASAQQTLGGGLLSGIAPRSRLPRRPDLAALDGRRASEIVEEFGQQRAGGVEGRGAEALPEAFFLCCPGVTGRCDGFVAAGGERDPADAGVAGVREAFGVAEALEFGDCFGGALLGHVELLGEVADGGAGVEEVLEDVAVGHPQVGEAVGGEFRLDGGRGGETHEQGEGAGVEFAWVEWLLHGATLPFDNLGCVTMVVDMSELNEHPNVRTAVRYHQAVARFAVGEELAAFFHPDAVHTQLPNALFPDGTVRPLPDLIAAAQQGRKLLADQHFEVINTVAFGAQVALEVTWSGTLAVSLGDLTAGQILRAHIAAFLEFRDGKIIAQRNYDCYERLGPAAPGDNGGVRNAFALELS